MFNSLLFIINHPLNKGRKISAIWNFIKWQITSRLMSYPIVYTFTQNSKLIMWNGLRGATGNLYCGLMEFEDMGFLLHFLRPEDLFVDIGANVGVYTILASGEIGAKSISIEPIPSTYSSLTDNININELHDRVITHNIGLGKEDSELRFTSTLDTVNHVAIKDDLNTIIVSVTSLDKLLGDKMPVLIKIDVEGFETEVINGSKTTLDNINLKAIIIELNNSGERYGYKDQDIHQELLRNGFIPFYYDPKKKKLSRLTSYGTHNTIYLRDLDFINSRIQSSRKIKIGRYETLI
ncbi:MAG: FkbM family methyltransferase [Saprospiraceae bacterium]|nr:FkbM family methyltransferase [Candidatus Brachybacter algidus]MBL0119966.1 FkbM family methyltransferase [Candidatus Brachybacter algidus]